MPFSNHNYTRRAENSEYMPTPTIVEAAQALYSNHNVNDITRSDAGARNLTKTTEAIKQIIRFSKENRRKSIVFVTGVPGAGKTLVGLNLASEFHNNAMEEHAIFLSGNLPLVTVLQEALARDKVQREKDQGRRMAKDTALREVRSFIQIIHHYRDEYVGNNQVPTERVAIFDESQRAWTQQEISSFMARKKGVREFPWSEPEFLIGTMDRRSDWATIVCLVGGGQEINKGEAGLSEWFDSLKRSYPHWDVYAAQNLDDSEYLHGRSWQEMTSGLRLTIHCCPATIIGPVVRIQFLIVPVLRRHVCIVRNIPGKVLVRPDVRAKEPVVLVADADFAHGGLEQRRHTVHGIRDRVVVTIVFKMIIVRHAEEILVITDGEVPCGERLHARLVIDLKCMLSGFADVALVSEVALVDISNDAFGLHVQSFNTRIGSVSFQLLNQMGLQIAHMVFNRWLALGLAWRRRKDNGIVEVLQIRENGVQDKLIL